MNLTNYKTTLTGIAAILGAGAHLFNALSNGDFNSVFQDGATIAGGVGLLFAKDFNVTGGTVAATKEAEKRV